MEDSLLIPERLVKINSPTDNREKKSVDEALVAAGGFGRYQVFVLIAILMTCGAASYHTTSMYFAADDPPWRCTANATSQFCSLHPNASIPESDGDFTKRCDIPRDDWHFTVSTKYSIVTEFDLVCKNEYWRALTTTSFFIGSAVGSIVFGPITDIYGRKIGICSAILVMAISSLAVVFTTAVWQIVLLRAVIGLGFGGTNMSAFIMLSESNPANRRSIVANLYFLGFTLSSMLMTLAAYYLQDWRKLLFYFSFASFVSLVFCVVLLESPIWLNAKRSSLDALKVLRKISIINGNSLALNSIMLEQDKRSSDDRKYSYLDLLSNARVFYLTILQCFLWTSIGIMMYGMTFEMANLGGSIYLNFIIASLSEFPSYLFIIPLSKYARRKTSICWAFFISSVLICVIGVVPESHKYARVGLSLVGRVSLNTVFSILYLWTFELFSTVLRSQGMNVCQTFSRGGSAAAPFLTSVLKDANVFLPFVIMASFGVVATFLGLLLPETLNEPIRQKYEDMLPKRTVAVSIDEDSDDEESLQDGGSQSIE